MLPPAPSPPGFPPVVQAAPVQPMARADLPVAQCSTKITTTTFTRKRALFTWWSVLGSHLYKFSPDSTFLGLCASFMCSFFVWLPSETACCRLVFALALMWVGAGGGWNWKVIRAGCGGMGHRAGWNFWASFEWPHSQYLTTNVNGFSDWILC